MRQGECHIPVVSSIRPLLVYRTFKTRKFIPEFNAFGDFSTWMASTSTRLAMSPLNDRQLSAFRSKDAQRTQDESLVAFLANHNRGIPTTLNAHWQVMVRMEAMRQSRMQ